MGRVGAAQTGAGQDLGQSPGLCREPSENGRGPM